MLLSFSTHEESLWNDIKWYRIGLDMDPPNTDIFSKLIYFPIPIYLHPANTNIPDIPFADTVISILVKNIGWQIYLSNHSLLSLPGDLSSCFVEAKEVVIVFNFQYLYFIVKSFIYMFGFVHWQVKFHSVLVWEGVKKTEKKYGIFHTCPNPSQPVRDMEREKIKFRIADS